MSPEKQRSSAESLDAPCSYRKGKQICYTYQIRPCPGCEERARSEDLFENGVAVHVNDVDTRKFMHDYVHDVDPLAFYIMFVGA